MKKQSILTFAVLIYFFASLMNAQTAPTLLTPANGATNAYTNQTFTWSSVPNAVYRIQISTGSGFWWNQVDVSNLTTTFYQASGLYMYTPYYWRVSATTESGTAFSTAWQFTTGQSAQSSGGPTLVFPANDATGIQIINTFQWNTYSGATSYRLQVSGSSSFTSNQVDVDNITATSYQVSGLYYSTNYYWRVGANTSNGIQYSDAWQFTTGLPGDSSGNPGPVLISPTNAATGVYTNNSFTWNAVEGATYRIQIATSDYFGYNQVDVSGLTSPTYDASGLYILTPYYWRVNATTSAGTSDWSTTWSFTTGTGQSQTPSAPVLASPANGSTNISLDTTLAWNTSSGAASYGLQAATDNQFNNLVVNTTGLTALSYNVTNLNEAVTYYWRVNASNSSGTSPWSSVWSFTTLEALPVLTVTQPVDSLLTNQSNVIVVGEVLNPSNIVKINGNTISVNPNGSFSSSINLIEGPNTIQIVAYNNSGDSVVVTRNVMLDTASPVLTITSPTDSLLTNQTSLTVIGSINEINSTVVVNGDTVAVDQSGNFSTVANLSEGQNIITIEAIDDAGNSVTINRYVTLDSIPPVLTIISPVDILITNQTSVTVNGSVNEINSTVVVNSDTVAVDQSGNFITSFNLIEGSNTISIIAIDGAGNSVTINRYVTLDSAPPVLTIISPVDSLITNQTSVTVNGSVNEINSVVTVNGDTVSIDQSGNFTSVVNLAEGLNIITINAVDAVGNSTTATRNIFLDTVLPVLTITNPTNSLITNQIQVIVSGNINETNSTVAVDGDTLTVDTNGDFSTTVSLTEGLNNISIQAIDAAGNSVSITRVVRLDSLIPVITITAPVDSLITNIPTLLVNGNVSDSTTVVLTVNQDTVQTAPNGDFTKQITLVEGMNTIIITAVDQVGKSVSLLRSVRLDTQSPVIVITYPANNFTTDTNSVHIVGIVSDSTNTDLTINSQIVALAQNGGFIFEIPLNPGSNEIEISAEDAAGNVSTINRTVVFQPIIIPPNPALIAPIINDSYAKTFYDANSFLWTGVNAIQYEVTPGSIEPHRVGVVRGMVIKNNGEPLPGVKVYSPNHPEWGYTFTRVDGKYDFGLNAGGYLEVNFERLGYRPANRIFDSPWNHFVVLDTVALVQVDPQSTVVNFTDPFTVAQSSVSTDIDGSRRATIFFEQGTVTTITLPDNSTQQLDSITARATEYTVGQYGKNAMPANLPPSVSYTYCTELTADEALAVKAKSTTFDKPARLFTENFIGFPVGTAIPTGIWNWDITEWIPYTNGIVLKIMGVIGGLADISIKPDGTVADSTVLDSLGISSAERQYIATVFSTGQEVWRTPLNELGIIDQGFGSIQPDNADIPKIQRPERFVNEEKYGALSPTPGVDVLNQTLHKEIAVTGTPLSLTYSSDRVEGRESQLVIPLTGTTIQPSLVKIILKVTVLGVETKVEFAAQPNLSYTYLWDGKDGFGRPAPGRHVADILIGYVHSSNYQQPTSGTTSFGGLSGMSIPGIYSRETTTLWQCAQEVVGEVDNRAASFGGWNLNIHNGYDQVTNTVYLGSGQNQITGKIGYILESVAGNGLSGFGGNNIPATQSRIASPTHLTLAPDGSIYLLENGSWGVQRIRKVDPDGIITTIMGSGQTGNVVDGAVAVQSPLSDVADLAVDKEGSLHVLLNHYASRLFKIDKNGIVRMIVGNAGYGYSGDGGPASQAKLWKPEALEIGSDGSIYISDQNCVWSIPSTPCYSNSTLIRKIDPDGIITTIAGGGNTYYSNPQTVPATMVQLDNTVDLKFGPEDDLYMACTQRPYPNNPLRHIIMKLGKDGRLHKISKGGYGSYFEEGKPADQVYTSVLIGLTFDKGCNLCYSVSSGGSIGFRFGMITPDYINNLLAGKTVTQAPSSPDGTPAKLISLNLPGKIEVGADGDFYFTESNANKIRRLRFVKPGLNQNEYTVNSTDGKEKYVFNLSGKHVRTEDALTNKKLFSFGYDADGKLITIIDVDSLVTTIERDTLGNPTAIVSPRGERTELAVNIDGYLTSVTNPNSEAIGLGYVRDGLLSQFTDPKNNSSLFDYDAQGRLISKQTPDEGAVTYTKQKTSDGYTVTETKPLGEAVVHRIYNQLNRDVKREVTNAQGISINVKDLNTFVDTLFLPDGSKSITETGFDPRFGAEVPVASKTTTKTPGGLTNTQQQLRQVTVWDGSNVKNMLEDVIVNTKTFRTEYTNKIDGVNNYVKSTSAEGRITEKFYDEKGRLIKEIIPGAGEVEYLYMLNRLTQKIHYPENSGAERTEFYFYDNKDRLISSTDPMWQADSMRYDNAGRLLEYVFKDGRRAHFGYDVNGNLVSIIPPGKTAHLFEFDRADKKTGYKPPEVDGDSLNFIKYVYNNDGNLVKTIYPDSSEIQMIYDTDNCNCSSSNRVKNIAYNGGTITYNYNSQSGQVTQVTTSSGDTLSYTYDGSLPKSETWKGTVNGNVGLAYNNDFRVTEQKINGANAVSFAYDKDGLMTQAGSMKMKYSPATGQLIADTLGNITSSYQYSDFGELQNYTVSDSGNVIFSTEYVRDDLGRITEISETVDGSSKTMNYTYDTAGRLIEVKKDGIVTANYIYDSNGNRLAKVIGTDSTKGTYDEQDRLLQYGDEHYLYNKNGYLVRKYNGTDTTNYAYDNLGNLKLVSLPNGSVIEYVTDANNRRIAKKVDGIVVKKWLYSGELTPIAELDSTGNVTARFVYGTKSNTPDYLVKGDTTYKIVSDHLGSVRLVINLPNGEVANRIEYDEYGNVSERSGDPATRDFLPFGFAGGMFDENTNLVRFGARDYSAFVGRWTAKDPIDFSGGDLNLFGYVLDNPINAIDPAGKSGQTQLALIGLGMAIGGAQTVLSDLLDNKKIDKDWQEYAANIVAGGIGGSFLLSSVNGFMVAGLVSFSGMAVEHILKGEMPDKKDYLMATSQTVFGGVLGMMAGKVYPRGVGRNPEGLGSLFNGIVGPNRIKADNLASWIGTILFGGFEKLYDNSQKMNNR